MPPFPLSLALPPLISHPLPSFSRSVLEGDSTKVARPSDDGGLAERMRKQAEEDGVVISAGKRTIAVQTIYRDSEAQTNPYTPDYVLVPGEPEPEVLAIAHLTGTQSLFRPSLLSLLSRLCFLSFPCLRLC